MISIFRLKKNLVWSYTYSIIQNRKLHKIDKFCFSIFVLYVILVNYFQVIK